VPDTFRQVAKKAVDSRRNRDAWAPAQGTFGFTGVTQMAGVQRSGRAA